LGHKTSAGSNLTGSAGCSNVVTSQPIWRSPIAAAGPPHVFPASAVRAILV